MTQTDVQTDDGTSENGAGAPIAPSGETLKNVLESLIFVSGRPVTPKRLARAARATIAEVQPLLDELVADYQHRGVHLYYVAGGYQFRSARESAGLRQDARCAQAHTLDARPARNARHRRVSSAAHPARGRRCARCGIPALRSRC